MSYNLTPLENMTNPAELATAANTASGGLFGLLILAAVYFLAFRIWSSRGMEPVMAFTFSSFVASIFGVLFWALGILSWRWAVLPLILLFVGFVVHKWMN